MNKVEKISDWLVTQNIDGAFITSTENVAYLTGFFCHPYERLLALFVFQKQAPLLVVPKLDESDARNSSWKYDVLAISDNDDPWSLIKNALSRRGVKISTLAIEEEHLIYKRFFALNTIFNNPQYVRVEEIIQSMRVTKSDKEIETMNQAAKLADYAIEIGINELLLGKSEMEIASALEFKLKKEGVLKMAFPTTVLMGKNAASPHGTPGKTQIQKGDLVLFDLGVVVDGYCSDISRTVAFDSCSDVCREIYQTVLSAQTAACEAVSPGKTCEEIDFTARHIIGKAGYAANFPHRLGHGLGISVHEFPDISEKNKTLLQAGMTFTIEPGIYVPDVCGVRIEDDILVTKTGHEVLTKFPKELLIVG